MKDILAFLKKMVGTGDEVSSKRTIGFLSWILIALITLVSLFTHHTIEEFVFDGLMWIVLGAFFGSVLEVWGKRSGKNPTTTVNVEKVETVEVRSDTSTSTTTTLPIQPAVPPDKREELGDNEIIG